jgi:elongation factor 3
MTKKEQKEREVRRRLRYIDWLNSPKVSLLAPHRLNHILICIKGTPQPPNTDDEAE